jgi:hypothetical protein
VKTVNASSGVGGEKHSNPRYLHVTEQAFTRDSCKGMSSLGIIDFSVAERAATDVSIIGTHSSIVDGGVSTEEISEADSGC